ncbi:DUF5060 domain-containing protein [Aliifodinibius sp. S!AR15-10]|uniref:DUF5060 domain-containing protein n=1 Tax=Aliifodinibius sp. S!AR15-10 TaxID=2950437 RepID=UPI0028662D94|nr:DUF5060 domain-containing protein [Aliifodinibius sp. S!AR15-10]MDR8392955.1 DUF5060 domain-containing protein [Aliifodinibius sp. S!AR15-10]
MKRSKYAIKLSGVLLLILLPALSIAQKSQAVITGEQKKWHKITLTFEGPETSENAEYNPFLHYRLSVTFYHLESGKQYTKPGFFAADGDAANSSASSGNKWRVHFTPDETGRWEYLVNFRKGRFAAVSEEWETGVSGEFMDKTTGMFTVDSSDKTGRDFRAKGRLEYVGTHYLEFAETGEPFLKMGADAPENFLAYEDFDGTFHSDGNNDELVKSWEPHVKDWNGGDPTWKDGKGKGIIGALNYLASEGLNAVSFLTLSTEGDDKNVFPHTNYNTYDRFDISKLAQWEIVFKHADQLGIFLHFKTQEVENQGLLDNGGVGAVRKLYYRELIARFGHHLALNWNLGEENGEWMENHPTPPQFTWQRLSMAQYFHQHDPYPRHIVIHNGDYFDDLLGSGSALTGPSIQTHHSDFHTVHDEVLKWRTKSAEAGKPWAVAVDEPGDAQHALVPDKDDPEHNLARKNALWGAMMAGAWGVEWYFGYDHDESDLTAQDYRSRDLFWDQCRYLLQFFEENEIPVRQMEPQDDLTKKEDDYVFYQPGEVYVVYQKTVADIPLDLTEYNGEYQVRWYNPKTGEYLQNEEISAGQVHTLSAPDLDENDDVAVLIKRDAN